MKKIILALSIILILFFIGCSASETTYEGQTTTANPITSTAGISEYYFYDFNYFEFSNVSNSDMLSYIVDDTEDFYIAMSDNYSEYLNDIDPSTITRLYEIVRLNDNVSSLGYLFNQTATRLNVLATEVGIELTVEDIVSFYEFKNNTDYISGRKSYRLETYISVRLDRSLTSSEEEGLRAFEEIYYFLFNELDSYDYPNKTFLDIIADLDSEGYVYTPEELDSIEVGFNLLIEVYN